MAHPPAPRPAWHLLAWDLAALAVLAVLAWAKVIDGRDFVTGVTLLGVGRFGVSVGKRAALYDAAQGRVRVPTYREPPGPPSSRPGGDTGRPGPGASEPPDPGGTSFARALFVPPVHVLVLVVVLMLWLATVGPHALASP